MSNLKVKLHHSLCDGVGVKDGAFDVSAINPKDSYPEYEVDKYSSYSGTECSEYYKKYEHDVMPVKDNSSVPESSNEDGELSISRCSLTNSDLKNIENKVYENLSHELQPEESSNASLESNIKLLKTPIQGIFDNYDANMQDFELYKKRFEEKLSKSRNNVIEDKENFIKYMIQQIMSVNSNQSPTDQESVDPQNYSLKLSIDSLSSHEKQTARFLESLDSLLETNNKGKIYSTVTTIGDNHQECGNKNEVLNIYLLAEPCSQMDKRNLLSEINIKVSDNYETKLHIVSAEDFKQVEKKKLELDEYVQFQEENVADREIPLKKSRAKKNIYLNEDFASVRENKRKKSLMAKLCSYICKKFRKA